MRNIHSLDETSNCFVLPQIILGHLYGGNINNESVKYELGFIQNEIDEIVFGLYELDGDDRATINEWRRRKKLDTSVLDADPEESERFLNGNATEGIGAREDAGPSVADTDALLSWAVGVAFGRFDVRLATGERAAPPEPDPFDPLLAKSPGMLPDGDPPFHAHAGILVDDAGHPHDLPHLIDRVLTRVDMDGPDDTRASLRRSFFPLHLRQYSKSRRKAPIYWPLSTASGDYTLWLYYPAITDQTLFIAANDFVGAKLDRQVDPALRALRQKTDRSRADERELEALDTLETELRALRAYSAASGHPFHEHPDTDSTSIRTPRRAPCEAVCSSPICPTQVNREGYGCCPWEGVQAAPSARTVHHVGG